MDFKALEDNLRTLWVLPASGLAPEKVYFADQDVPSPAPGPCISIRVGDIVKLGHDELTSTYDGAKPNGQEVIFTASGPREITVSLEAFSPGTTEAVGKATARQLLSQVEAALGLPTIRPALNQVGIGVLRSGPVRWQPGIQRAAWEGRAMLDTIICVSETATGAVGYIATVNMRGTVKQSKDDSNPATVALTVLAPP